MASHEHDREIAIAIPVVMQVNKIQGFFKSYLGLHETNISKRSALVNDKYF